MAGRSLRQTAYRLFTPAADVPATSAAGADEFDESDIWGDPAPIPSPSPPELFKSPVPRRRKKADADLDRLTAPASLPVSVPDWSKILRGEYNSSSNREVLDDDFGVEEGIGAVMIPPHELLWRSRAASLSVHEGFGRTLKGRDLRRVRNAIWEKTGFED